jgi:hypothetical protein
MPRDVEQFVPYRLFWYVYQQLQTIQRAAGYNTDADVHIDATAYSQSQSANALFLYCEDEGADDQQMGGGDGSPRVMSRPTFTVLGSVRYGTDLPLRAQMALEQDVRTAIQTSVDGVRAIAGVGVFLRWGECDRFIVSLTGEREAGFRITCSFTYPQGSTW